MSLFAQKREAMRLKKQQESGAEATEPLEQPSATADSTSFPESFSIYESKPVEETKQIDTGTREPSKDV